MSPSNNTIKQLLEKYPFLVSFLEDNNINFLGNEDKTLREIINLLDKDEQEELAINIGQLEENLEEFIDQMSAFLSDDDEEVHSITIFPGTDKSGAPENYKSLELKKGEIVCIVGPTGSGKSRLLGDIEWVAQCDTPTNRRVLVNNEQPDSKWRFSISDKLVAQLSQNMNFVMDLSVEEFVTLHAESRMIEDIEETVKVIIENANDLAGERFSKDTPITSLSGGQSRALMIADTAHLSRSPVILIDEIENAGIDRKRALDLLLAEDKIVLLATHDPTLALLGNRRVVIKNGGIDKIIETSEKEREILSELEVLDKRQAELRNALRHGEKLR
ncbi:ATP-binding cassette domain-containing protein [Thiospirochaeta perfilievii]|uniref:ATP-binding cassette domain-containing protein n=1 Tax=Thiospirochaeta perfilievii TaxID=252967 RepID=A0A5C1QFJ5_9SPIO|nr:ATP-binding cassette domain-containing protein [Thiospirochaeta perfilievii]QEN05356.1 ATP-binding cassette domain-containing protein [Thiospirochaeta perfilievii]